MVEHLGCGSHCEKSRSSHRRVGRPPAECDWTIIEFQASLLRLWADNIEALAVNFEKRLLNPAPIISNSNGPPDAQLGITGPCPTSSSFN